MPSTVPTAPGPEPGAGRGGRGDRVAAGHERIGAVVDVEHHRLGTLEQDAACRPAAPRPAAPRPARRTAGCAARAPSAAPSAPPCRRSPRRAPRAACCGAAAARRACPTASPARRGRRPGSRAAPPCPRRPGRCPARWCRSCASPRAASRARSIAACSGRISVAFSAIRSFSGVTAGPAPAPGRSRRGAPRGRPPRRCR